MRRRYLPAAAAEHCTARPARTEMQAHVNRKLRHRSRGRTPWLDSLAKPQTICQAAASVVNESPTTATVAARCGVMSRTATRAGRCWSNLATARTPHSEPLRRGHTQVSPALRRWLRLDRSSVKPASRDSGWSLCRDLLPVVQTGLIAQLRGVTSLCFANSQQGQAEAPTGSSIVTSPARRQMNA